MSIYPTCWLIPVILAGLAGAEAPPMTIEPVLSLSKALGRTLEHSPVLAAYSWELRAAEARTLQAGLRPNPEIALEFEEIGIRKEEAEGTILLSQLIEMGGKRAARLRFAQHEQDLSRWDYECARMDALERTAGAFIEALGAQERQAMALDLSRLAEEVWQSINARVQAGRVSLVELERAQVLLTLSRLDAEDAANAFSVAQNRLAANWGGTQPDFVAVAGRLDSLQTLPELEAIQARILQTPDLARWSDEIRRSAAALALARSRRVPDPALQIGYRRTGFSSGSHENSLVLGFSMTLPLFDRNQGNIREAEHLARKTGEERRAATVGQMADLLGVYQTAQAAYRRALELNESVLPQAGSVSERIREGYSQGKFGYLEVLDAERSLFELRTQYLDTLVVYHGAVLRIERLTGMGIFTGENEPDKELSE